MGKKSRQKTNSAELSQSKSSNQVNTPSPRSLSEENEKSKSFTPSTSHKTIPEHSSSLHDSSPPISSESSMDFSHQWEDLQDFEPVTNLDQELSQCILETKMNGNEMDRHEVRKISLSPNVTSVDRETTSPKKTNPKHSNFIQNVTKSIEPAEKTPFGMHTNMNTTKDPSLVNSHRQKQTKIDHLNSVSEKNSTSEIHSDDTTPLKSLLQETREWIKQIVSHEFSTIHVQGKNHEHQPSKSNILSEYIVEEVISHFEDRRIFQNGLVQQKGPMNSLSS